MTAAGNDIVLKTPCVREGAIVVCFSLQLLTSIGPAPARIYPEVCSVISHVFGFAFNDLGIVNLLIT